jgi:hypothetical protein
MRVSAPAPSSITLGWNPVPDAVKYNIYRSPAGAAPVLLGSSNAPSYTDSAVSAGAAYYYTLAPVNAGGKEGVWVQGAFAYAASHFALQDYSSSPLMHLPAGSKHYYRFALNAGQNITVTWENGGSQNADANVLCSAWQNDGTAIFTGRRDGYTAPQAFTAAVTGYITVVVENGSGFTGYDYRIYYN